MPTTSLQERSNFWKDNYENLNIYLRSVDWPKLLEDNTADNTWQIFENIMLKQIQLRSHKPMKDEKRKKKGIVVVKGNDRKDEATTKCLEVISAISILKKFRRIQIDLEQNK